MKVCTVCGRRKRPSAFSPRKGYCRACRSARDRAQIDESRRWIDAYARKWRRSTSGIVDPAVAFVDGRDRPPHPYYWLRHKAIMAYGGYRCACCGEGDPNFLTLDHVNNDGARHRRRLNSGKMLNSLRKRGYPKGLRVLCANCNQGRYRNGGECPHRKKRRKRGEYSTSRTYSQGV